MQKINKKGAVTDKNIELMKLQGIQITGLFGLFDYNIGLNDEGELTILTGPNGYGKTTILNIIYSLFNQRFFYFQKLNFESVSFYFEGGKRIDVSKKEGKVKPEQSVRMVNNQPQVYVQQVPTTEVLLQLFENSSRPTESFLYNSDIESKLVNELGKYVPMQRISQNTVLDNAGRQTSLRDFLINNIAYLPVKIINFIKSQGSDKIFELLNSVNVYIIKEERLLTQTQNRNQNISFDRTIEKYSEELRRVIEQKQIQAYQMTQQLDSSFPKRLIERKDSLSETDFNARFEQLKEKQRMLQTFGISMTDGISTTEQDVAEYSENTAKVLTVYLEDSEKKVGVYDDLLNKIELFVNILNEKHFAFKSIKINGNQGFYFQSDNGQKLSLSDLSSGEQHEIVLLYELLFRTNPNTLILIDEPEISLHVLWQKAFIKDLQKIIAEVKQISFLVATHSPQIINDNWDLAYDLFNLAGMETD